MNAPETRASVRKAPERERDGPGWRSTAWLFLLTLGLGSALSAGAFLWLRNDAYNDAQTQFERNASDAHHNIEARVKSYTDIVHGLRALLYSSSHVTRRQFHDYVAGLDLARRYPGFLNLNYAEQVTHAEKAAFVARVKRDEDLDPRGYPDFSIQPPGDRPYYHVLVYLEPMRGNESTLGRDIVAQPGRREIFERQIVASEELSSSGRPVRVEGPSPFWGVAMRLPVYRQGVSLEGPEQRRIALRGTLGAGFRVDELLRDVLSDETLRSLSFRVYEAGSSDPAAKPEERLLLFDSRVPRAAPGSPPPPGRGDFEFSNSLRLNVAGRAWDIEYGARRESVLSRSESVQPWLVFFGGLLVSLLLFGTALSLASSRSRAVALASEMTLDLQLSESSLKAYAERLKAVSRRLFEVQESERKLLAAELHDRAGQNLSALGMNLSIIAAHASHEADGELARRVQDSTHLIEQTADAMRNVMAGFRPAAIDEYGLLAPLRALASGVATRTGIEVSVSGPETPLRLPREVELTLFRIAQEALNNVAKHAGARRVNIELAIRGSRASLSIHDDGIGFNASAMEGSRPDGHWGLLIMRERAEAAGGRLTIESTPGEGTTLTVEHQVTGRQP